MWVKTIRKLLFAVLGVVALCAISFVLLQSVPGDSVLARLQQSGVKTDDAVSLYHSAQYEALRQRMGYHLPPFYFSIQPSTVPEALHKIPHPAHRKLIKKWCIAYGKTGLIESWYTLHTTTAQALFENDQAEYARILISVLSEDDIAQQQSTYKWLIQELASFSIAPMLIRTAALHRDITAHQSNLLPFLPSVQWYGSHNQFHRWFFGANESGGIIRGDFGISLRGGQPVTTRILPALKITALLAAVAVSLMYITGIPLGLWLARIRNERLLNSFIRVILGLYAMPNFWLGALMLTFLCNPRFLNLFPVAYSMINISTGAGPVDQLLTHIWHLALPVTCWFIGGAAFLTIQTYKQSDQLGNQLFITTARAKGLSERHVSQRHILKNAIVPAVSMLGSIIPAAISGAIAIELIFSIPGMGVLIFNAFHTRDYPLVMGILLIAGTVAILSTTLADVLQQHLDPRLKNRPTA